MRAIGVGLLFALMLLPAASAQVRPGPCEAECNPRGADMNGESPRAEGPVRVLLYSPPSGVLGTHAPRGSSVTKPNGAAYLPQAQAPHVDACGELVWRSVLAYDVGGVTRRTPLMGVEAPLRVLGPVNYYLYLQTGDRPQSAPVPPRFDVTVRVGTGSAPWAGTTLAEGRLGPSTDVASAAVGVWEHRIALRTLNATWGGENGFHVTVRVCHANEPGARAVVGPWSVVHGATTPNRLAFTLENPVLESRAEAKAVGSRVRFEARLRSTLGYGDLDCSSIRMTWSGPGSLHVPYPSPYRHQCHGLHEGSFRWEMPREKMVFNATHTFGAESRNTQGTYLFRASAQLYLAQIEGQPTPVPVGLLVLAAVFAVGLTSLRRSRPTRRPR